MFYVGTSKKCVVMPHLVSGHFRQTEEQHADLEYSFAKALYPQNHNEKVLIRIIFTRKNARPSKRIILRQRQTKQKDRYLVRQGKKI